MCMALLVPQDDFRLVRDIAGAEPRKNKRW
jgi:hypothetical protein